MREGSPRYLHEDRRKIEGYEFIDRTYEPGTREWLKENMEKSLGYSYHFNENSPLLISAPHAQEGISYVKSRDKNRRGKYKVPFKQIGRARVETRRDKSGQEQKVLKGIIGKKIHRAPTKVLYSGREILGTGDPYSGQLVAEIGIATQSDLGEMPSMIVSSMSQASVEQNIGHKKAEGKSLTPTDAYPESLQEYVSSETGELNFGEALKYIQEKIDETDDTEEKESWQTWQQAIRDNLAIKKSAVNLEYLPNDLIQEICNLDYSSDPKQIEEMFRKRFRPSDPNYKKIMATLTGLKIFFGFNWRRLESLRESKAEKDFRVDLNMHTAYDQIDDDSGELIDCIIGSVYGLSTSDPSMEIALARHLQEAGLRVCVSSLVAAPKSPEFEEPAAAYKKWAEEHGVDPGEFSSNEKLRRGVLAGLDSMVFEHQDLETAGVEDSFVIQVEHSRSSLMSAETREKLVAAYKSFYEKMIS